MLETTLPIFYDSLIDLAEVHVLTGNLREAERLLLFGLTVGDEEVNADDHLRLKIHCADILWKFGDIDEAEAHIRDETHPEPQQESLRLYNLGEIFYVRRFLMKDESVSIARVLDTHREAFDIRRTLDDEQAMVLSMSRLGTIYERLGDHVEAYNLYQRSLKLAGPLDYKRGMTRPLTHLGVMERNKGDWDSAADYFQKALDYSQEIGFAEGMAFAHFNLGYTLFGITDDKTIAQEHYSNGMRLANKMEFVLATIRGTMLLASLHRLLNQKDTAKQYWEIAKKACERVGYQAMIDSIEESRSG